MFCTKSSSCRAHFVAPTAFRTSWRSPRQRRVCRASAVTDQLQECSQCSVTPLSEAPTCQFKVIWNPGPQDATLLVFFTHWADLGSWELAQRLVEKLPEIQSEASMHPVVSVNIAGVHLVLMGVKIVAVGVGTKEAGQLFAEKTKFPSDFLFADSSAACHKALGYSAGFLPGSDVNGYVKLLPMLAGIGSPGTVQEVLRGYVGDRESKEIFGAETFMGKAFGVLGGGYQRPFELATVRLQNMIGSLNNWADLAPADTQLLVQQGGSLLMRGTEEVLYAHSDTGILMTTPMDPLMDAVQKAIPARLPEAS